MTTKEELLKLLLNQNEKPVSGEELAKTFNISRAGIWKIIKKLREEGYNIQGTTNGGYVLNHNSDVVSSELFYKYVKENHPEFADIHMECFKVIDSTNTYAKRLLSDCGNLRNSKGELTESGKKYHKAVFIAESQTAGKGRLGRQFVSPLNTGIYITVIYAPEGGIKSPALSTSFAAVSVVRSIKKFFNKDAKIKWINDIFVDSKKVCGILAEGSANFETGLIESAIVGIGINLTSNKNDFSEELLKKAGSVLNSDENADFRRIDFAAEVACQLLHIYEEDEKAVIDEYKKSSFLTGKTIQVYPVIDEEKSSYKAKVLDINDKMELVVQKEDGSVLSLNSGEVSLKSENF